MKTLLETFIELVKYLEAAKIQYAVMGGLAVRLHGIVRTTYDIDITIACDDEVIEKILAELPRFEFEIPSIYLTGWRDRVADMPIIKLKKYCQGEALDVDIFIADTEFQFNCIKRRINVVIDNVACSAVTAEDLILFKLLSFRNRDKGDIQDVLFTQPILDVNYMRQWAKQLEVEDRLLEILRTDPNYASLLDQTP